MADNAYKSGRSQISARPSGWAPTPSSSRYEGKELKQNPGFPDSRMEAYRLPSIVNGKRVMPKGAVK